MTDGLESLVTAPAADHPELLAAPTASALRALDLGDVVRVFGIDPAVSDTAATRDVYGLDATQLVNCVIVAGRRDGVERIAACLVPSNKRVDVNGVVRRRLDVRKASFLGQDDAVTRTGMEYGGITPIGLPADWPVLVDEDAAALAVALIGSGIRASKLLLAGAVLAGLPNAEVVPGLGRAIA